jgi:ABC-type transporter Mla MlaB component
MGARQTVAFAIRGPIARSDLPGLCERVCALLGGSGARLAVCDVHGVEPDAVTVDALCRLQLAARRNRCHVQLRGASDELLELVSFMGLSHVLGVEARRQAEEWEQGLRLEEERELADPAVSDLDHL